MHRRRNYAQTALILKYVVWVVIFDIYDLTYRGNPPTQTEICEKKHIGIEPHMFTTHDESSCLHSMPSGSIIKTCEHEVFQGMQDT